MINTSRCQKWKIILNTEILTHFSCITPLNDAYTHILTTLLPRAEWKICVVPRRRRTAPPHNGVVHIVDWRHMLQSRSSSRSQHTHRDTTITIINQIITHPSANPSIHPFLRPSIYPCIIIIHYQHRASTRTHPPNGIERPVDGYYYPIILL